MLFGESVSHRISVGKLLLTCTVSSKPVPLTSTTSQPLPGDTNVSISECASNGSVVPPKDTTGTMKGLKPRGVVPLTVIFSVLEGVATTPPPWQVAPNVPDVNRMVLPEVISSVGVGPL